MPSLAELVESGLAALDMGYELRDGDAVLVNTFALDENSLSPTYSPQRWLTAKVIKAPKGSFYRLIRLTKEPAFMHRSVPSLYWWTEEDHYRNRPRKPVLIPKLGPIRRTSVLET